MSTYYVTTEVTLYAFIANKPGRVAKGLCMTFVLTAKLACDA